jgi:hypothetical protein
MTYTLNDMTRREFLRTAGLIVGGATLAGAAGPLTAQAQAPRVGIARNTAVWGDGGLDPHLLGRLIDEAVMWAVGEDTPEKAWAKCFSADEVVGLKPNGIAGYELSTLPETISHCVDRLEAVGIPRDHVIVWEQNPGHLAACGVPLDDIPWGVRAVPTDSNLGEPVRNGSFSDRLCTVLDECDAFVNLPILKDHSVSGVTAAMKNHYGSIGNPGAQHAEIHQKIVDLNDLPQIKDKTRLVICDMVHTVVDGGPFGAPHYFPGAMLATTDFVACDAVCWYVIEEERARRGIPTLKDSGREPLHIAGAQERGLGVADLGRINVNVIDL